MNEQTEETSQIAAGFDTAGSISLRGSDGEEGRAEGQLQLLYQLVNDGLLTLTEASKRAEMTEDEFAQLLIK